MSLERNVWVMSCSVLLTITCIFSWYKVFPNHLRELGATETQVGVAFMVLMIANRVSHVAGGFIADRFGRKRILVISTLLMAPFYALTGFMTSWTTALLALAACWFVSGLLGPSIITIVSDSVPEHRRGKAIGTLETAIMIAITIGPWIGAQIMRKFGDAGGLKVLVIATACVYVIVSLLRATLLIETHLPHEAPSWKTARFGILVYVIPVGFLVGAVANLSIDGPFLAMYGRDRIALTQAAINEVAFFGGLAALATAIVGGEIVDRAGAPRVLTAMFLLMTAMLAPFAWSCWNRLPLPAGIDYLLLVLLFAPAELFSIAYQKFLTSSAPKEHRALHVGLASAATGILASFVNVAAGYAYGRGAALPFAFGAACAAVGTVVSIALWRSEWLRKPSTASAA